MSAEQHFLHTLKNNRTNFFLHKIISTSRILSYVRTLHDNLHGPLLNNLYHNLLPPQLREPHNSLLGLGGKHTFITRHTSHEEVQQIISHLLRAIKIRKFFEDQNQPQLQKDPTQAQYNFLPSSGWTPDDTLQLIAEISANLRCLKQIPETTIRPSKTVQLLQKLKKNQALHITIADKNFGLVIQTTQDHDKMVRHHLDDRLHYVIIATHPDSTLWRNTLQTIRQQFHLLLGKLNYVPTNCHDFSAFYAHQAEPYQTSIV